MKLNVLIVEDDALLAEAVADYFESKEWHTCIAADGEQALEKFDEKQFQLILLDVMLPKENGFSVCRKIRSASNVPIFFITARVMEEDELNGYALGADDYITKPFSLPVLYAKAMAMMGRIRGGNPLKELRKGDIRINLQTREVSIHEILCPLPPIEYRMLVFFLENPNRIFSRDQLLIRFWGYDFDGNERVVDNHIKKLRKALQNSQYRIQTVPKAGYRMEEAYEIKRED
ncbi:MAG: response regulator transcription factor [Lachnospiraceae bacterium]